MKEELEKIARAILEEGVPIGIYVGKSSIVKMKDQYFPDSLFIPMQTGTPIDLLFSEEGGIYKACNYMLIGDPGIGKSTISMDIASNILEAGYRVLYIMTEMTRIDVYGYVKRFPKFGNLEMSFSMESVGSPKTYFESLIDPGYDLVILDSYEYLKDTYIEFGFTGKSAAKSILDVMLKHNLGLNQLKINTTFLLVQHVTKEGNFMGPNSIKHAITGMVEARRDKKNGEAYLMFDKNRRGKARKKLGFSVENIEIKYKLKDFLT